MPGQTDRRVCRGASVLPGHSDSQVPVDEDTASFLLDEHTQLYALLVQSGSLSSKAFVALSLSRGDGDKRCPSRWVVGNQSGLCVVRDPCWCYLYTLPFSAAAATSHGK